MQGYAQPPAGQVAAPSYGQPQPAYGQPQPAYQYPPQPAYYNPDEVRTIFVTGFPQDVKERELRALLRFIPGYEVTSQIAAQPQAQEYLNAWRLKEWIAGLQACALKWKNEFVRPQTFHLFLLCMLSSLSPPCTSKVFNFSYPDSGSRICAVHKWRRCICSKHNAQ